MRILLRTDKVQSRSTVGAQIGCDEIDRVSIASEGAVKRAGPDLCVCGQLVSNLCDEGFS